MTTILLYDWIHILYLINIYFMLKNAFFKQTVIYYKTFFGFTFWYVETDWKIRDKWYLKNIYFPSLNNLWLAKAKNKIKRVLLTRGEGSLIINLNPNKRRSMKMQLLQETLARMEAQPIYSRFTKIQQLEKKISILSK